MRGEKEGRGARRGRKGRSRDRWQVKRKKRYWETEPADKKEKRGHNRTCCRRAGGASGEKKVKTRNTRLERDSMVGKWSRKTKEGKGKKGGVQG